jgi:hypothetical protein
MWKKKARGPMMDTGRPSVIGAAAAWLVEVDNRLNKDAAYHQHLEASLVWVIPYFIE